MIELFEPVAEAIVLIEDGFGRAKVMVTKAKSKAALNNMIAFSEVEPTIS